jgi:hypothetical protein
MNDTDAAGDLHCYRVWLRSAPGMWERYEGHVDVWLTNGTDQLEAKRKAVRALALTSFPDRPSSDSWVFERMECKQADADH